ncbi:hypothetical protein O0I10_008206 [Lichtheimia ornata]|uniref:Uncharacterized protein n=1 Tax=Lichtheimia ornata TaxID=688661 RepID=A0AAD7UYV1_9FUNG|nr:uncharacterized protein O0I10_008206 [Lichtheimia ornata]KAJ8656193.1 hypothetical protein O0I10_008206 [Lichtheimia ornata]
MATSEDSQVASSSTSLSSQKDSLHRPELSPSSSLNLFSSSSLDQLSSLARRTPGLNTLSAGAAAVLQYPPSDESERKRRIHGSVQQVTTGIVLTAKLAFNDCSIGLYQVADHIQRKVPVIVEDKKRLRAMKSRVETADSDITDARKVVADMEQIQSFQRISEMLKTSLDIVKKAKKA